MVEANPVLAHTTRSGVVETWFRGRVAITDPDGRVDLAVGDVDHVGYPRSATKAFQAIAMLECGLPLDGPLLALVAASHSGWGNQIDAARQILSLAGLTETALDNTPDYPLSPDARTTWIAAGQGMEAIAQNCSGKHAAMLYTCVVNGWPTDGYLDPTHPLQRAITAWIDTQTTASHIGIDGCGAPAHAMSTLELAIAYGRIAAAKEDSAARLADAFRAFPEMVSGPDRFEAKLHHAVPGLICKIGAAATLAIGLPNGAGIAIKVDDGGELALPVIAVEALGALGLRSEALTEIASVPVLGGGQPVGEVVASLS